MVKKISTKDNIHLKDHKNIYRYTEWSTQKRWQVVKHQCQYYFLPYLSIERKNEISRKLLEIDAKEKWKMNCVPQNNCLPLIYFQKILLLLSRQSSKIAQFHKNLALSPLRNPNISSERKSPQKLESPTIFLPPGAVCKLNFDEILNHQELVF